MSDSVLRMVSLSLDVPALMALGRRQGLPLDADLGYLVHVALREVFRDHAPAPFRIRGGRRHGRSVNVLAYGTAGASELRDIAERFSFPESHAALDWESLASKEMPVRWPAGLRLGFEARLCPVVRKSAKGQRHRKGAEVDVFLAHCWDLNDPSLRVDREEVYRGWLRGQIENSGAARLVEGRLASFQRTRLLRRTHGVDRRSRKVERPDALMRGTLEVRDAERFLALLARGIGRHRAFGFGMMLLSPCREIPRC